MSCRDTTHVANNNFVTIWLNLSLRKRFPSVQFCSGRDGLKEEEISVAQGIHSHYSPSSHLREWSIRPRRQQQVPSIMILRFLLNPIPDLSVRLQWFSSKWSLVCQAFSCLQRSRWAQLCSCFLSLSSKRDQSISIIWPSSKFPRCDPIYLFHRVHG